MLFPALTNKKKAVKLARVQHYQRGVTDAAGGHPRIALASKPAREGSLSTSKVFATFHTGPHPSLLCFNTTNDLSFLYFFLLLKDV
jgi:hypothetical protein